MNAMPPLRLARVLLALAMASAVSLGLARFAYALLLPAMRDDLGWSYATAGFMNTVNAAGYLLGALWLPQWLARWDARVVVGAGGVVAALALALHAVPQPDAALAVLRVVTGMASAASFAGGGLLAARLAQRPEASGHSGRVLGVYYGGTGVGIILAAVVVPAIVDGQLPTLSEPISAWRLAWVVLALGAALAAAWTVLGTRALASAPIPRAERVAAPLSALRWALLGYLMFGLGYIGYMTFIVALWKDLGLSPGERTSFFVLLGVGVVASSALWAGLLQRARGGGAMALLNGLLALATALPVVAPTAPFLLISGVLFGSVFLSVVASTTALVRHNLPPPAWPSGIAAFTVVFAAGQIVGPVVVGAVSDHWGAGLSAGFAGSAAFLALGAVFAALQRPLPTHPTPSTGG